jgi:hypothetical protein
MKRIFPILAILAGPAAAHDRHFTPSQNEWLNRQYALDAMKCCDEHDVHIGVEVQWRHNQSGDGYEVMIEGEWRPVPSGRIMRENPRDPSPWGHRALLFHTGRNIWCFRPAEPLT